MKRFAKALFLQAISVLTSCVLVFFLVKHVTDRRAPQECSKEVEQLKKALKRHGNLDSLVLTEYDFTKAQKKRNLDFFQNNIKHLNAVADKLRAVIYRNKNICEQLTREYGLVKEQLLLMQDKNLTEPEFITVKENSKKLSNVIELLSKIEDQEQDALLMVQNVKQVRCEQLRILLSIEERLLDAQLEEQPKGPFGDKKKNEQIAWEK